MVTGIPVDNFFNRIYETLCVLTALQQDHAILMWLPSPKLIYEWFLILSLQILKIWLTQILLIPIFFQKVVNLAKKIPLTCPLRVWQSDGRLGD